MSYKKQWARKQLKMALYERDIVCADMLFSQSASMTWHHIRNFESALLRTMISFISTYGVERLKTSSASTAFVVRVPDRCTLIALTTEDLFKECYLHERMHPASPNTAIIVKLLMALSATEELLNVATPCRRLYKFTRSKHVCQVINAPTKKEILKCAEEECAALPLHAPIPDIQNGSWYGYPATEVVILSITA